MTFTEKEIEILKKWLEWNKEASLTNKISDLMTDRIKELQKTGEVTNERLLQDAVFQNLKTEHDTQAAKCEQPFKDFKKLARGEEV